MKLSQIHHRHIFLKALRTGLLFIIAFIVYEIAIDLDDPPVHRLKSNRKKMFKFIIILVVDVIILYSLYFATGEYY